MVLRPTEGLVADLFGFGRAVLFGRARSGLAALLDAIGGDGALPFVMPSNICSSVFAAATAAGADVRLADVDGTSGLPADETYREAMERAPRPGVVMITYLYGFARPYPRTLAAARAGGWFVLENDAAATKARTPGTLTDGPVGDALLVSFGAGKVIDGGTGGAVLTDDDALAKALRDRRRVYPPLDDAVEATETRLMLLRREARRRAASADDYEIHLAEEAAETRYRLPESRCAAIERAIAGFPAERQWRRDSADEWTQLLSETCNGIVAAGQPQDTPWRFIARIPRRRDRVAAALRENGIDAGTNYPPLHDFFPVALKAPCGEGGRAWGDQVINLWLSPAYDKARKRHVAEIIARTLAEAE